MFNLIQLRVYADDFAAEREERERVQAAHEKTREELIAMKHRLEQQVGFVYIRTRYCFGSHNVIIFLVLLFFVSNVAKKPSDKSSRSPSRGGGGVLPYMGYTGTCRWIGYGFWPLCPEQGI